MTPMEKFIETGAAGDCHLLIIGDPKTDHSEVSMAYTPGTLIWMLGTMFAGELKRLEMSIEDVDFIL